MRIKRWWCCIQGLSKAFYITLEHGRHHLDCLEGYNLIALQQLNKKFHVFTKVYLMTAGCPVLVIWWDLREEALRICHVMFGVRAGNLHSKYHNTDADSCSACRLALLSLEDTKRLQHLTYKSLYRIFREIREAFCTTTTSSLLAPSFRAKTRSKLTKNNGNSNLCSAVSKYFSRALTAPCPAFGSENLHLASSQAINSFQRNKPSCDGAGLSSGRAETALFHWLENGGFTTASGGSETQPASAS